MKIAILSVNLFDNSMGGVENHIRFISKELTRRGHEIMLFKPVWEDKVDLRERQIENLTIFYIKLGKPPFNLQRWSGQGICGYLAGFLGKAAYSFGAARVVKALMFWQPELVWQHDFSSNWWATRKLARFFPVVLTNHSGEYLLLKKFWIGRILLLWMLRHYKAIIGPSRELTPDFPKKAFTIHNGVDTRLFVPLPPEKRNSMKRELFGDTDRFVIFCPRRWAPTKGIIYLAKAIQWMGRNNQLNSKFIFVFAGSETQYPKYVEQINRELEDFEDSVIKLGSLNIYEMVRYYQSSDLIVIPSVMEAVSLAALESMACGTPVISTHVGGMPEIIEDGETGYLISPCRFQELGEAILRVYKDPHRALVAEKALAMIQQKYDWSVIATNTEKVLLKAVKDRGN